MSLVSFSAPSQADRPPLPFFFFLRRATKTVTMHETMLETIHETATATEIEKKTVT